MRDGRSGDTICIGINGDNSCGEVLEERRVDTGEEFRNFEGEEVDFHFINKFIK